MLITSDTGKTMLVDFGTTAPYLLRDEYKIDFRTIDSIYISHPHADHAGGLEFFAFSRYFMPLIVNGNQKVKPNLIIPYEIEHTLWENTLKGGMGFLEEKNRTLHDYFNVFPITGGFAWNELECELIQTPHVMDSYGVFIKTPKNKVLITTDTKFNPKGFDKYYNESTVIFHDTETLQSKSGVHAHYTELSTLDPKIKKKIHMYHYGDEIPTWKEDGFAGFVKKGQEFDL